MDDRKATFEPFDEAEYTSDERIALDALDGAISAWAKALAAELPSPAVENRAEPEAEGVPTAPATTRGATGRRWGWALSAAAVAALLYMRWPTAPVGVEAEDPSSAERGVALLAAELDAASERPFMLVPSSDPSIAIVWILDTDETTRD